MPTYPVDQQRNLFAKTAGLITEWQKLERRNPRLVAMVLDFAANFLRPLGYPAIITSIFRPDAGGIHAEWRAVDLRAQGVTAEEIASKGKYFADAEGARSAFNVKYPYGMKSDGHPGETIPPLDHAAAQQTTAVSAPHFHIQVRP